MTSDQNSSGQRILPTRVTQACRTCASNHLRCSEEKPCRRCEKKGIECIWNNPINSDSFTPPESDDQIQDARVENDETSTNMSLSILPSDPDGDQDMATLNTIHATVIGKSTLLHSTPTWLTILDPSLSFDINNFSFEFPDLNLLSGNWSYDGLVDMDLNAEAELDDMDMQFLNNYNANIPFEFDNMSPTAQSAPGPINTEAFRSLYWRFRPDKQDHMGNEEQYLSIPSESHHHTSPESLVHLEKRVTCAELGNVTRDKILTMVVQCCRPETCSKAVASFPSVKLLDTLLQYYLTSPVTRAASFLHLATFDPNTRRPELVAIMAAAGAVLTSDPALAKLGYAIQECVRVAVPRQWEQDNTLIRDLQLSQAWIINLEIGLWSGYSRKVEIAESFLQPLVTMLRRDGKLKRSGYSEPINGTEANMSKAWLTWIESESWKRLAYRLLSHDASSSMALLVNPLISYAEFTAPVPASEEVWSAESPEHWKPLWMSRSGQTFTIADFLADPEALVMHRDSIEVMATAFALVSYSWSLCWEFIQLNSLQRTRRQQWNALVMSSRSDELVRLVSDIRAVVGIHLPNAMDVIMMLELVLLHIHMPFEDIQIFAGIEGSEQARSSYPFIRDWAQSESARRSVYHASQIIRVAKELPRGYVHSITAMMLYHASLSFLVYGLLAKQPVGSTWGAMGPLPRVSEDVYLDQAEDFTIRKFLQHGSGSPCIQCWNESSNVSEATYLSNPRRIIGAIVGILRGNFGSRPRPHLVDKMMQLMTGLEGSLAGMIHNSA